MKDKHTTTYWQVIALGILAGMRSASAPAVASHMVNQYPTKILGDSRLSFMQNEAVTKALKLAALGEFIGDKLPFAKDRIIPFSVAGRFISGAIAGATLFKAGNKNAITGALLGGGVAIASTFASFHARKAIGKYTDIFDQIIGLAEDILVVGVGVTLAKTTNSKSYRLRECRIFDSFVKIVSF